MKKNRPSIAVFGGAFDPVHLGHLKTARSIQSKFHFDHFFFLPCKSPLLKKPAQATANDRVNMLKLALSDDPAFEIDQREIQRATPSYMVNSLQSYRKEYPDSSISLILGLDAFAKLPQWHQWESINELAHLLVIERPGFNQDSIPLELKRLIEKHGSQQTDQILARKSGLIVRLDAGSYDISSTQVRCSIKKNNDSSVPVEVTEKVYDYIRKNKLYQ